MRPPENDSDSETKSPERRRDYSLFYFQHEGGRTTFRFSPLGAALIVLMTLIPLGALFIFVMSSITPGANVNIRVPPASTPSPDKPLIRQAPPVPPPRVINRRGATASPPTSPTPNKNINRQPDQQQPTNIQPSKPPT